MTDVFSPSDEDLNDRTWEKLKRNLQKEGFREGASKGQEEAYQTGFDLGYSEGFRLGEVLGYHKGLLSVMNQLNMGKPDMKRKCLLDDNDTHKACVLCQDSHKSEDVKDILSEQKKINDSLIVSFTLMNDNS